MNGRADIVELIQQYGIELFPRGGELFALCPFHQEKNPSFAVNAEKQLFYCHSCGTGGDVITFVEKIERVDFKTALKRVGGEGYKPSPETVRRRGHAKQIAEWGRLTSIRLRDVLRDISDEIHVCSLARKESYIDKKLVAEHEAALIREWAILCDLDDDMNTPLTLIELYAQREQIENFVEGLA
jgi:hypothetical protein